MKFSIENFIKKDRNFPKLNYRSIKKDYEEARNVNIDSCKKCGGYCCKTCGCHFSPDDFKSVSYRYLKNKIKEGYISIVYVSEYSSTGTFILRMRNYGAPIVDLRDSGFGGCIILTEKGCPLPYDKRPSGAKLLIPQKDYDPDQLTEPHCQCNYTLEQCAYEWLPHKKTLYRLARYFRNRNISPKI